MIEIDGSYGEGGGQILRTSIALCALVQRPLLINNIRVKRAKPGLSYQHIHGIKAMQSLTNATVKGLELGSTKIEFFPESIRSGKYDVKIGTAGSISLILQGVMIPSAFADGLVELTISGGTDVKWSPPIDYVNRVQLKVLEKMGYNAEIETVQRGYYPRGNGRVKVEIRPVKKLKAIDLTERGRLIKIHGISHSLNLPCHVVERMAKTAEEALKDHDRDIKQECNKGFSTGCGITLWAEFENSIIGASALGELGKRAERVGEEAGKKLLKELTSSAPLDRYMGDQIIPYMALAEGDSKVMVRELTGHLKTNIHITEKILGNEFEITEKGGNYIIETEGIGFENEFV